MSEISKLNDVPYIVKKKQQLEEYVDILMSTSIFNENNNIPDIKELLLNVLQDLYINEPEDVINYLSKRPSAKLMDIIFSNYGIDEYTNSNYPSVLKNKTCNYLSQLFEYKGSNVIYSLLNDIVRDFYQEINFYNVRVHNKEHRSFYEDATCNTIYYLDSNNENINPSVTYDESIEFKLFIKINANENEIIYRVKFFEPLIQDVLMRIDYYDEDIICHQGQEDITIKFYANSVSDNYKNPQVEYLYYINDDLTMLDTYNEEAKEIGERHFIDSSIVPKITFTVDDKKSQVIYLVEFINPPTHKCLMKISNVEQVVIETGEINKRFVINVDNIYNLNSDVNDLTYVLYPILINDPSNILTEIEPTELSNNKYLMTSQDYLNFDYSSPKNVFPIETNILLIQFNTTHSMDTMKYYPDLIRMYSMTYMQNTPVTFSIYGTSATMPMSDYMDILMYMKLRELKINNNWSWETKHLMNFTSFTYPVSDLPEIKDLIALYRDLKQDHTQFTNFKLRYQKLLGKSTQLKQTKISNLNEFYSYFAGNLPLTFESFFQALEEYYPLNTNFLLGVDQNKLIIEKISDLFSAGNFETVEEFMTYLYSQPLYENINLYEAVKMTYTSKYPRIIKKINDLTETSQFISVLLDNYKRMTLQINDDLIQYFIQDTFQRFLLAGSFKEAFFEDTLRLFTKYFFKAELTYQHKGMDPIIIKDKMHYITTLSKHLIDIDSKNHWSEINLSDYVVFNSPNGEISTLDYNDLFIIQVTNEDTGETYTSTSEDDKTYDENSIADQEQNQEDNIVGFSEGDYPPNFEHNEVSTDDPGEDTDDNISKYI